MAKEAVFAVKLNAGLRDSVQRQCAPREHDEFVHAKVEAGRASMRVGRGRSNDEVEAEFSARRSVALRDR